MKTYDDLYRELMENSAAIQENTNGCTRSILNGQKEMVKRAKKSEENIKGHVTADGDKTRGLLSSLLAAGGLSKTQKLISWVFALAVAGFSFFYYYSHGYYGKTVWTSSFVDGVLKSPPTFEIDMFTTIALPVLIGITAFLIIRLGMESWNAKHGTKDREGDKAANNDQ